MTPDPMGNYYANPAFPQSWNLYSYVMNNPVNLIDPSGLDCVYMNDIGQAVESIDHHTDQSECWSNGGYWANGTVTGASSVVTHANDNNLDIFSTDSSGNSGWTNAGVGYSQNPGQVSLTVVSSSLPGGRNPITDQQKLMVLKVAGLEAAHDMACIAIPGAGLVAGGAAFKLGQPVPGSKPFQTPGSSAGTSPASEALRDWFPQTVEGGIPTPVGGPGTGTPFRMASTTSVGGAAARYLPFVGAAAAGYEMYKMNQCLNQKP
jgi:hypothetical protein